MGNALEELSGTSECPCALPTFFSIQLPIHIASPLPPSDTTTSLVPQNYPNDQNATNSTP